MTARPAATAALVAGAVGAVALAQLLPATASLRRARNRFLPRLAGVGAPGHVALTFDDGPDAHSTPAFLDTLDELGWRATFFMLATMAERAPDVAAEVARRGHEIAVHGSVHSNHLRRGPLWVATDMARARDKVAELTGASPKWARPPYGALSASSLYAAHRVHLRPVLWTTWGRDWRPGASGETVARDVAATMVPGATVLLHDSDCTSAAGSWKATLAALPVLAERWRADGLAVGPLSEHGLAA